MTAVQACALVLVAFAGTAVVLVPDPLRQALTLGVYGFALTLLFFSVQAPDVALSEIVVSGLAMPLIVVASLRKLNEQEQEQEQAREPDEKP